MKINKLKVALSMVIPFLTVFIVIFLYIYIQSNGLESAFNSFFNFFTQTAILWTPSVVICLVLDMTMFHAESEKKQLRHVLIVETIVASIMSLYFFPVILGLGIIGNILRYQWLIARGRVFAPSNPTELVNNQSN